MSDKIEPTILKEQADLVRSIAWQYAHPFQTAEEFNEWNEIHNFAENVFRFIEELEEDNNEKESN